MTLPALKPCCSATSKLVFYHPKWGISKRKKKKILKKLRTTKLYGNSCALYWPESDYLSEIDSLKILKCIWSDLLNDLHFFIVRPPAKMFTLRFTLKPVNVLNGNRTTSNAFIKVINWVPKQWIFQVDGKIKVFVRKTTR